MDLSCYVDIVRFFVGKVRNALQCMELHFGLADGFGERIGFALNSHLEEDCLSIKGMKMSP